MSVKLRMTRMGRRHRPFFRINAIDSHTPRDGRIVENLGHYDPIEKDQAKQLVLKLDRVKYWLEKGAIPSDTVAEILSRQGIKTGYLKDRTARRAKALALTRKKGLPLRRDGAGVTLILVIKLIDVFSVGAIDDVERFHRSPKVTASIEPCQGRSGRFACPKLGIKTMIAIGCDHSRLSTAGIILRRIREENTVGEEPRKKE